MTRFIVAVTVLTVGVLAMAAAPSPAGAEVRVGIHVGFPGVVVAPPAPVYVAPAPVYVPPAPVVIAPSAPVYYYGSSYYTYYSGGWFIGPAYGGPWRHVAVARVPRPLFVSPHAHVFVPRGHVHHIAGPGKWHHGHGHGHGHGRGHWKH